MNSLRAYFLGYQFRLAYFKSLHIRHFKKVYCGMQVFVMTMRCPATIDSDFDPFATFLDT